MPGIFPDTVNGGIVIRDGAGVCLAPSGVPSAYCPPASFTSSCQLTALPSDCTARISAAQINAIVSEIVRFAYVLNPDGNWNCATLTNLSDFFAAWSAENKIVDNNTIVGAGTTASPWTVSAVAMAAALGLGSAAYTNATDYLRLNVAQILTGPQLAMVRSNQQFGTAVDRNVGIAVGNLVEVIAGGKLPTLDGSNLTNIIAAGSVAWNVAQALTAPQKTQGRANIGAAREGQMIQVFLNVAIALALNTDIDIVATGAIGAAGETWEISAVVGAVDASSAASILFRIHVGGTSVVQISDTIPAAGFEISAGMVYKAVLTGPTNFTLGARNRSTGAGFVIATGISGLANRATCICARYVSGP
jgi:hypothetical protein